MSMPLDHEDDASSVSFHSQGRNYTGAIVTISMLIAFLFAANLYTLDRLNAARQEEKDTRSGLGNEIREIKAQDQELLLRYARLKESDARQIADLGSELDYAAKRLGKSTGQMLDRTRAMANALHELQARQANAREEPKADTGDFAGLVQSVSSSQSQLGTTQRTVDVLASDLGTTRSELGEVAASVNEKIKSLEDLGEGEYREFTLERNHPIRMGPIGLRLRKASARDQVFSLDLLANDQEIHNKEHSVFVPIFFYLTGVSTPCEAVITAVGSDNVAGYLRFPKAVSLHDTSVPKNLRPEASNGGTSR
jgi:hypothetical protein